MKLKEILDKTVNFFRDKGIETARMDAELLLCHALKMERIQIYLNFDRPVAEPEVEACRKLVQRRARGEPVAYIVGEKGFYHQSFHVGPGVLVPRPETEHLVEEALAWMKSRDLPRYGILDLGCGSGCIGLTLLKLEPRAYLFAVDNSEKALTFAEKNSRALDVHERCVFIQEDAGDIEKVTAALFEKGFEDMQIILSNPPYLDERDTEIEKNVIAFEPPEALFAGNDGFEKLQKWSRLYSLLLSKPGLMMMEMGYRQGSTMKEYFEKLNFDSVEIKKDFSGHDRIVKGEIHG